MILQIHVGSELPALRVGLEITVASLDEKLQVNIAVHFQYAFRRHTHVTASHWDCTKSNLLVRPVVLLEAWNVFSEAGRCEVPRKGARLIMRNPDGKVVFGQILVKEAVNGPGTPERLRPRMRVALERHDWDLFRRHREVLRIVRVLFMKPEH